MKRDRTEDEASDKISEAVRSAKNRAAIEKCSGAIVPIGSTISSMFNTPISRALVLDRHRYRMSVQQITLPSVSDSDDPAIKYGPVLTEIGRELLYNISARVLSGKFNAVLTEYSIYKSYSGPYIPDVKSPYYDGDFIEFNSFDNVNICGFSNGTPIKTGYIIMYTDLWAWSSNGMLYKLEKLCDIERFEDCFD